MANTIYEQAKTVFADGPSGSPSQPAKSAVRSLFKTTSDAVESASIGRVDQATWAGLSAIAGTAVGQPARVLGPDAGTHTDPVAGGTVKNIGEYLWSASPAGWRRVAGLDREIIYATNTNSGNANAVTATADGAFDPTVGKALVTVPFVATNTGAMSLSIDGETPRPLVTNTGTAIPAGYVQAGMSALVQIDSDGNYRLFSYGDASAIQAAAESARDDAEAANTAAQAAAINAASYDPTLRFPSMIALLTDTSRGAAGVGAIWQGGDFLMEEADAASTDYHTVKGGDVKLYAQPVITGGFDARQWGSIADGTTHPLSERYSTLVEAQAAFPLTTAFWASEKALALTDEIDWAACQEAALLGKQMTYKPMVRFGDKGILMWNRQVRTLGNNNGITMGGPEWTVPHQGSTPTGVTLCYTGNPETPEYALDIRSGYDRLRNLAFWNTGNGKAAFRATGATGGTSGAERVQVDDISIIEAVGTNPWSEAACVCNSYDYMKWGRLELTGSFPVGVLIAGLDAPGTTRFRIEELLVNAYGAGSVTGVKMTNCYAEHLSLLSLTMNFKNSGGGAMVDTSELSGSQHLDILDVYIAEHDIGGATGTGRRVGKLKNTGIARFSASSWQDAGTEHLFELDTGILELNGIMARSVSGSLVSVANGYPTEKVYINGGLSLTTVGGIVDATYGSGKVPLTQAASIILDGHDSNHRDTVYELTITAVGTAVNMAVRDQASTPKGTWLPGETIELHVKNTAGANYSNLAFNSSFKMLAGYTLTAIPNGQTAIFKFRNEGNIWRQTAAQINTTT